MSNIKNPTAANISKNLADDLWSYNTFLQKSVIEPVRFITGTQNYPAQYQAIKNPSLIDKQELFADIMKGNSGAIFNAAPQVVIPITERDSDIWTEKKKITLQKNFDEWLTNIYNPMSDPIKSAWLNEIYPEYFEARVKENEDHHKLQASISKIKISGPSSIEDLFLLYRLHSDKSFRDRLNQLPGNSTNPNPATTSKNSWLSAASDFTFPKNWKNTGEYLTTEAEPNESYLAYITGKKGYDG